MTTLRDIAEAAGVSVMTVSNVVNGRHGKVSPATVARVQELVRDLGYVPNASARALSGRASGIVALVYPDPDPSQPALANAHDATFVGEVQRQVSASGRFLMIHAARDVASTVADLRTWGVDGAIFLGTFGSEVDALRDRYDIPMVFVDNYSESGSVTTVRIDDARGGDLAARHLTAAGHTRVAFAGPETAVEGVVRRRLDGFLHGLREGGADVQPDLVLPCAMSFRAGHDLAGALLESPRRPTAVFATADVIAIGILKGLADRGLSAPHDLSVVGFDDLSEGEHRSPMLTTIRQDVPAKARASVDLLLAAAEEAAEAEGAPRGGRVVLDVELVERETVGAPRAAGPTP